MKNLKTKITSFIILITFFSCSSAQEQLEEIVEESVAEKHLFILSGQSNMVGLKEEQSFIPELITAFAEDEIVIVKEAKGSQPISQWYKNWKSPSGESANTGTEIYNKLLLKVNTM